MRATLSLGRWFGVPVGANAGVLVILTLVGFLLGAWHFPTLYPDRPVWSYATAGAVAALLLIGSVLLHELAHAVVAQANGIKVERIMLWLFGGVAQLRSEPRTAAVDLAVAAVGPATSLVLGGVFGVAAVIWVAAVGEGLIAATLGYLGAINVLLAVFNLVPAAPLDGGRVLRAVLWWFTGNRNRAAVVATRAGRVFGVALIAFGLAGALLWAWFGGLWLALIGWFLVNAASAEERSVVLGRQLSGVQVADVMSGPPVTAPPEANISSFIDEVVLHQRFSTYPLVDEDGRLTGLVTLNRIRQVPPDRRPDSRLRDIACPPEDVPTAHPEEPLIELLPRLAGCTDGRAVVVDPDGRVIGVVSPRDVTRMTAIADLREPATQSTGLGEQTWPA
ncbi:MAG TPA: site-2 protease family protein [Natronosporangium sp.]|nr:site-2 protease family protein [Natronosporangium sp.]